MNYKKYKKVLHQIDPNFKILRSKSLYIGNIKCLMLFARENKAALIRSLSDNQYDIVLFDNNTNARDYTYNTDSSTGTDTCIHLVVSVKDKSSKGIIDYGPFGTYRPIEQYVYI
ncbi:MAG TPA: hypothetical protein OIM45_07090 [Clostridiaceae bacterium]|jgi:hypothetical protein|nr:hypothetical protein [Clostridiaceae bacterium]